MSAGCSKMQELNLGWCKGITDDDARALHGMSSLTNLQLSRTSVSSRPPESCWPSLGVVWTAGPHGSGSPAHLSLACLRLSQANESIDCKAAGGSLVGSS